MKDFNIDTVIKMLSNISSIVGLFTIGFVGARIISEYTGAVIEGFCIATLVVLGLIGLRFFIKTSKQQLAQKHNLKHERLLTYRK